MIRILGIVAIGSSFVFAGFAGLPFTDVTFAGLFIGGCILFASHRAA